MKTFTSLQLLLIINHYVTSYDIRSGNYIITTSSRTFEEGEKYCLSKGWSLPVITDLRGNYKLTSIIKKMSFLIRGSPFIAITKNRHGVWKLRVSSKGNPLFRYWCMREPNNRSGNEQCVELKIRNSGCWNDIPCSARRPTVCQIIS